MPRWAAVILAPNEVHQARSLFEKATNLGVGRVGIREVLKADLDRLTYGCADECVKRALSRVGAPTGCITCACACDAANPVLPGSLKPPEKLILVHWPPTPRVLNQVRLNLM